MNLLIPNFVYGLLDNICQLGVLLLMVPMVLWLKEDAPSLFVGRISAPLWGSYHRFVAFWWSVLRMPLPRGDGVVLALVVLGLLTLSGFTLLGVGSEASFTAMLADPLFVGCLLLSCSAWVFPVGRLARYGSAFFILCLTEILLVLAEPGVNGLLGVHHLLLAAPGSSLAGTSICCALALAITNPMPDKYMVADYLVDQHVVLSRMRRDQRQVIVSLLHVGWLLLLGDLFLPVLVGLNGIAGVLGLVIRFGAGVALALGGQFMGRHRYGRSMALLMGLAALMALAGRFAA